MPSDPLTLGLDTSGPHCAVALLRGGTVLAATHEDMMRGQAERLMPLAAQVLASAKVVWADLDAVAVGTGPGNFTGLRIAVAATRGLALALGRPAYGVSHFDCLGAALDGIPGEWLLAVTAPRGQFYVQRWRRDVSVAAPALVDPAAPPQGFGEGLAGVYGVDCAPLADALGLDHRPADMPPFAQAVAQHAARAMADGRAPDTRPAPLYIRPADAAPSSAAPVTILP